MIKYIFPKHNSCSNLCLQIYSCNNIATCCTNEGITIQKCPLMSPLPVYMSMLSADGNDGNIQPLSQNTGMFNSPAKFVIVKPDLSYENSWNTSQLKMVKLFSCPIMCSTWMNDAGSRCLWCMYAKASCSMISWSLSTSNSRFIFTSSWYLSYWM